MFSTVFVGNMYQVSEMLRALRPIPTWPPSLFIDLEGVSLSRNGSISLLTLLATPLNTVYLVDIFTLGSAAFCTPASLYPDKPGISMIGRADSVYSPSPPCSPPLYQMHDPLVDITLKSILESHTIPKVFFDVRNDSDALFAHFYVKLRCIHDVQLMELAVTTRRTRKYLIGLSNCIKHNINMSQEHAEACQLVKEHGVKLFSPEHGGTYEVFNERPLKHMVVQYCVMDVVHLPQLWNQFDAKMDGFWKVMVHEATADRVEESQSVEYKPIGEHKRLGCWSQKQIVEAWRRWFYGRRSGLCCKD